MKHPDSYILRTPANEHRIVVDYGFRRRMSLTVYPDGKIVARFPKGLPFPEAERFLHKRAPWLDKHSARIRAALERPPIRYIENELHPYLGKSYPLKLCRGSRSKVLFNEDSIRVACPAPDDPEAVRNALERGYRNAAVRVLTARYRDVLPMIAHLALPPHSLRFYKMKRRWGSCSAKGVVTLNTELIKKAPESIDYVILHELCHLKVPAHNKAFYALLESVLPDWKELKITLP